MFCSYLAFGELDQAQHALTDALAIRLGRSSDRPAMRVASLRTRRAVQKRSWRFAATANSSRMQAMVALTVRWSVASPSTRKWRS